MDDHTRRSEVRTFLRGRRARVRPEDVGLPAGNRRRVPGLRREEVAALAGVGVTWYTMFENGTAEHVSREVVDSVARALRLDDSEREHLRRLAGGDTSTSGSTAVDPLVQAALDDWITAPAYVSTAGWDVIAWNEAFALVWGVSPPGGAPFNMVLRHFGDPAASTLHGERWEAFARSLVAMMRVGYATRHDDPRFAEVMDTLRRDPNFVALWERQEVLDPLATTAAEIDSPGVGRFAYRVLNLMLPAMGQALIVQVPETESAARLDAALSQRKRREAV
jgi:transcriptional regulator with XRE-family HTH domain